MKTINPRIVAEESPWIFCFFPEVYNSIELYKKYNFAAFPAYGIFECLGSLN